jgi:hypothetical protein
MKKILFLMIVFAVVSGNAFSQKTVKNDTILMIGKVVKEQFVHGKVVEGVYDYFFQSGDKKYFIKEYGSAFTKEMLDKWLGESVWLEAIVKNGTWDTTDDPKMQQSRGGEYITILYIEKKLKD